MNNDDILRRIEQLEQKFEEFVKIIALADANVDCAKSEAEHYRELSKKEAGLREKHDKEFVEKIGTLVKMYENLQHEIDNLKIDVVEVSSG